MKVVRIEFTYSDGSIIAAKIYPFLEPEDSIASSECEIGIGRARKGERFKVILDFDKKPLRLTHLETIELCEALLLASKLANVYTDTVD